MSRKINLLVVHFSGGMTKIFSYHCGWVESLRHSRHFNCTFLDTSSSKPINRIRMLSWKISNKFDAVVVLHSAFANSCQIDESGQEILASLEMPLAFFVGNEYKQMPEKLDLARCVGTTLFISQSNSDAVLALYRKAMDCKVICIPSAALDPTVFYPTTDYEDRELDLGFIGNDEPIYFGHQDRKTMSGYFIENSPKLGLKSYIVYNEVNNRLDRKGYAEFLNKCKAQLGTESGSNYFELNDELRRKVIEHIEKFGSITEQEVFDNYLINYSNPVPLRIISGRNAEAAGTKSLQILFEGHYNGYMLPNVHYLPLKKDFSNIDEVMRQYRDRALVEQIRENAYAMAMEYLTFDKLLNKLFHELSEII